jgi:hypothetical protein
MGFRLGEIMTRDEFIKLLQATGEPNSEVVIPICEGLGLWGVPIVCAHEIESVETLIDDEVNQVRIYYKALG